MLPLQSGMASPGDVKLTLRRVGELRYFDTVCRRPTQTVRQSADGRWQDAETPPMAYLTVMYGMVMVNFSWRGRA
jgi:hypothetical protein